MTNKNSQNDRIKKHVNAKRLSDSTFDLNEILTRILLLSERGSKEISDQIGLATNDELNESYKPGKTEGK